MNIDRSFENNVKQNGFLRLDIDPQLDIFKEIDKLKKLGIDYHKNVYLNDSYEEIKFCYEMMKFEYDKLTITQLKKYKKYYIKNDKDNYFNFLIKGDSLILKDINDNKTINRIKRLDDAQLVFYNLLEHEKKQVYNRKE